jgi:hypothetical protein
VIRRLSFLSLALAAAACGTTSDQEPPIQNLNRPVDIAFTCYGQMRITGDGVADADDPLEFTPQPVGSCTARTKAWKDILAPGETQPAIPVGQENLTGQPRLGLSMRWLGFAVQSASGTVAVIEADIPEAAADNPKTNEGVPAKPQVHQRNRDPDAVTVQDADLLTPGKNALTVGSLPVAIAADASGCYMATANAGSCDLSVINVDRVFERSTEPQVRQLSITTPNGAELLARPAAMISDLRPSPIGVACPATPQGNLYIAYPDCHAIAVVDAATGVVQSSILFDDTGTATIGDGNLSCPAECGESRMPTIDGARPVTLELVADDFSMTRRLAVGLDNRPVLTVVDLDTSYLPTATIEQYELEGDVGVIDVALTPVISMTGQDFWNPDILPSRAAQFIYAVATDATVRVVDVYNDDHECDTQIDPRFLQGITDPMALTCFQPGGVGVPPRRTFARGPGIQFPNDDAPLSVAAAAGGVTKIEVRDSGVLLEWDKVPTQTIGYFAFVTSSLGVVYVVNIDDDNYRDTFNAANPLQSQVALAMSHQLRDGTVRGGDADDAHSGDDHEGELECDDRGGVNADNQPLGMPRADNLPTSFVDSSQIAQNKGYQMPYVRQRFCDGVTDRALPEVMFATDPDVRAAMFPDLRGVGVEEDWTFQWEGSLSLDDGLETAVDGPQVRTATVSVGGGAIRIQDPSKPFCDAGVERFDNVQLVGCNPEQGDAQCGLGERCFVHPDSAVAAGACLPEDSIDELAGACRDFMISVRRFAVQQSTSGELVLSERRRVLRTSPIGGCVDDQQCQELADYAERLSSDKHPREDDTEPSAFTYTCAPDPTRSSDINRCQMTCTTTDDCEEGTVCSAGFCLEGTMPPPECLGGLQRYTLNATEALVAIGSRAGYVHNLVEGAGGVCEPDPAASPLQIGRIKLDVDDCVGEGPDQLTPNPCALQVEHWELVPNYEQTGTMCGLVDNRGVLRPSQVRAIRFRNQSFNLTITDPTYPGDLVCRHDRLGGKVGIPVVYPGFAFAFHLVAGFQPLGAAVAVMPTKIVRTPDDVLWIVDEGDVVGQSGDNLNIQGQILRINADVPTGATAIR